MIHPSQPNLPLEYSIYIVYFQNISKLCMMNIDKDKALICTQTTNGAKQKCSIF